MKGVKNPPLPGHIYGNMGQLTVLARTDERDTKGSALYLVKCSICEKDPELFGDGTFKVNSTKINLNYTSCGCGPTYKYSIAQQEVRVRRYCDSVDLKFKKITTPNSSGKLRALVECEYGHETHMPISFLVHQHNGCGICRRDSKLKSDDMKIKDFVATGKFAEGTRFSGCSDGDDWEVECPICSEDSISVNGGPSTFKSTTQSLTVGHSPCRCSPRHAWSEDENIFRARLIARENNLVFLGWVGEYKGTLSKLSLYCPEHGVVKTKFINFTKSAVKCPACARGGFKAHLPAYIYVIKATEFTGYGITNYPDHRANTHRCAIARAGMEIEEAVTFEVPGKYATDIERSVKQTFKLSAQPIAGFRTEATDVSNYTDVVSFVKKKLSEISDYSKEQPSQ